MVCLNIIFLEIPSNLVAWFQASDYSHTTNKYRKSLESKVPLDAHGNPIAELDEIVGPSEGYVYLEERTGLTGARDEDQE